MAEDVRNLILIVVMAALFVILFVPGVASEAVQHKVSIAFAMFITILTIFGWHIRAVNRLSGSISRFAALCGPFAAIPLLWITPRQHSDWVDVLTAMAGFYMLGVGLVAGIVWFGHRH